MSAPKITLRPPPNVEFVQGYPGIPPAAPDRPLAGVKGTLEVRVGAQGVKAKWVRVELRKVETLPGGGQTNTFFDFIGESPINVWQADEREEWKELRTQDFPFFIRIPESIPPSIALERNAGIKYELIATVCLKGKKGIFRRTTTPMLSTSTPIVIDKHELHSTWPIYSQPDSRHVHTDALSMTVERTHTCYGPGDRVVVVVILRNDGITTVAVRALEFVLRETIIFRASPHASGKKGGPIVRTSIIGEQKVPINLTIYGGTQHRVELSTMVPQGHTTTTVTAARHIDITYSILVNAVLPVGKPLLMELPITISNWPRNMSIEAVRRIGPTPNLSLLSPQQLHMHTQPASQTQVVAITAKSSNEKRPGSSGGASQNIPNSLATGVSHVPGQSSLNHLSKPQMRPYSIAERVAQHPGTEKPGQAMSNTVPLNKPASATLQGGQRRFDEFGYPQSNALTSIQGLSHQTYPAKGNQPASGNSPGEPTRQRSATATNPTSRLTIANISPEGDDNDRSLPTSASSQRHAPRYPTAAEEKRMLQQQLSAQPSPAVGGSNQVSEARPSPSRQTNTTHAWPSAEEEKAKLYERAKAQVESTQGKGHAPSQSSSTIHGVSSSYSGIPRTRWETAEEEKTRLFEEARRAAEDTHARVAAEQENMRLLQSGSDGYGPSAHTRYSTSSNFQPSHASYNASVPVVPSSPRRTDGTPSVGAQLYSSAMASINRPAPSHVHNSPPPIKSSPPVDPVQGTGKGRASASPSLTQHNIYPSAEEEKAALRYYEAKLAVERAQNIGSFVQGSSSQDPVPDEPIAYDALYPSQDSVPFTKGHSVTPSATNGVPPTAAVAIPSYQPPTNGFDSALSEKERLRRRYEEEEAAASAAERSRQSPPPGPSSPLVAAPPPASPPLYGSSSSRPTRSQPLPPVSFGGSRPLTAAEEKARLKAQYEAEEAAMSTGGAGPSASHSPPTQYGALYGSPTFGTAPLPSPMQYNIATSPIPLSPHARLPIIPAETIPQVPPPLMPRPPAQYIQETQEVDARVQVEDDMYVSDENTDVPYKGGGTQFPNYSPTELTDYNASSSSAPPRPPKIPVVN